MSQIRCRCGNILHDNTDSLRFKGHVMSDRESFAFLEFADEMIESTHPDREESAMTFRRNIGAGDAYIRLKTVYQCPECGRILMEHENGHFCSFMPEDHCEKQLLDFDTGTKKHCKRSV